MKILDVYIEHGKASLDRPFSYLYDGPNDIEPFFRVMVDFHGQRIMGFVAAVHESNATEKELEEANGFALNHILEVVDSEPLLNDELKQLAKEVSDYYLAPYVSVLQSMLPLSLRPARSALHGPKIAYETWVRLLDPSEDDLTSEKQVEILRLLKKNPEVLRKDLGSPSAIQKLLEFKKIELFRKEKERFHLEEYEKEQPRVLTFEQEKALETILLSHKEVTLLQGVTGSGKTEVYLALSEKYLSANKNVLMLVPEISLTPIMVEYFSRRFQNNVAILHSGLTPAEKYDEYRKIAQGRAHIVIGARSAVFAPLQNIGLIMKSMSNPISRTPFPVTTPEKSPSYAANTSGPRSSSAPPPPPWNPGLARAKASMSMSSSRTASTRRPSPRRASSTYASQASRSLGVMRSFPNHLFKKLKTSSTPRSRLSF